MHFTLSFTAFRYPWCRNLPLLLLALVPAVFPLQADAASWSARVGQWQTADMDPPAPYPGPGTRRQALTLAWEGELLDLPHRISWTHQPILIRAGSPAQNGYFHQLDVHAERPVGDTTLAVTVGVHGSSNMFKHGDFHSDALVATVAALHRPEARAVGIGFFGDYRFDRFRLYPRVQFDLDAGKGSLSLDLPVTARWRDNAKRWSVGIERVGEKWGALDASRRVESVFRLSEWQLDLTRQWRSGSGAGFALTAGVSVDTEVRYLDLAVGARKQALDTAAFLRLEFSTGG